MKNTISINKKDVKEFLNTHPLKEFSAARFEYSIHVYSDFENSVAKMVEDEFNLSEQDLIDLETVENISSPEELLRFMRKPVCLPAKNRLRKKLLENENAMMPLIKEKCIRNLQDVFIENALDFFITSKSNESEWILDSYSEFQSEYLKSMFCLVIGFRGELDSIPFLISETKRFGKEYSVESFDQGPLLAVHELVERFHI